jgi:cobalt/nickel transport system ATP-binding protein
MSVAALVFDHVTVRYEEGDVPAIDDVSFSVEEKERVALVGLNGSGKTTLLMTAVGLAAHEGGVRVCGIELSRRTVQEVRACIGFLFNVPEDQLLFPKVADDVSFALVRKGVPAREARQRTQRVLEALGVGQLAQSPVHHLSHGQKQRVALAGVLVSGPRLLLLDEPSAALDPPGKRDLTRLLVNLDAAMVVATHDLELAAGVCSRFVVLEKGRVVFDGPDPEEAKRCWSG